MQPAGNITHVSGTSVDTRTRTFVGGFPTLIVKDDQVPSLPSLWQAQNDQSPYFIRWTLARIDCKAENVTHNRPLGSTINGAGDTDMTAPGAPKEPRLKIYRYEQIPEGIPKSMLQEIMDINRKDQHQTNGRKGFSGFWKE